METTDQIFVFVMMCQWIQHKINGFKLVLIYSALRLRAADKLENLANSYGYASLLSASRFSHFKGFTFDSYRDRSFLPRSQ